MQKQITVIRDIDKIEEYLKPAKAGVLAFNSKDEKLLQFVTPFLYRDKNIFITLEDDDELLDKIILDSYTSFVTVRENNTSPDKTNYNIVHVTLSGILRKVDEQKVADEIISSIQKKYKDEPSDTNKNIVLILDTEEIQAAEERGG